MYSITTELETYSKIYSIADISINNKLPGFENKLKDLQNKVPEQGKQTVQTE